MHENNKLLLEWSVKGIGFFKEKIKYSLGGAFYKFISRIYVILALLS